MKKHLRITVAVLVGILFLATSVAHACIGIVAAHDTHHHGGVHAAGPVQHSHPEAQDENCRSLRDRLLSLAPRPSQSHSLVWHLDMMPTVGETAVTAVQMFTAERPPGTHWISDNQSPLYIFNSVFRI
jgi:hypothetical protein